MAAEVIVFGRTVVGVIANLMLFNVLAPQNGGRVHNRVATKHFFPAGRVFLRPYPAEIIKTVFQIINYSFIRFAAEQFAP